MQLCVIHTPKNKIHDFSSYRLVNYKLLSLPVQLEANVKIFYKEFVSHRPLQNRYWDFSKMVNGYFTIFRCVNSMILSDTQISIHPSYINFSMLFWTLYCGFIYTDSISYIINLRACLPNSSNSSSRSLFFGMFPTKSLWLLNDIVTPIFLPFFNSKSLS